jgi:CBS domain-containing protein
MSNPEAAGHSSLVTSIGSVAELFHRLNRVIPEDQKVVVVPASMPVGEAFVIMRKNGFSQLPVVEGHTVLGMFSYRSFAAGILRMGRGKSDPGNLPVEDFVEKVEFVRATQEFKSLFDWLNRDDVVFVGDPDGLQAVVTTMDILQYLYNVANPFVFLAEIELALRALITRAVTGEQLAACARVALSSKYGEGKVPTKVTEMSFNDYATLIGAKDTWQHFTDGFGARRESVLAKLDDICDLRNNIFHFKRELTWDDHEKLMAHRDWALQRITKSDALLKGERP